MCQLKLRLKTTTNNTTFHELLKYEQINELFFIKSRKTCSVFVNPYRKQDKQQP